MLDAIRLNSAACARVGAAIAVSSSPAQDRQQISAASGVLVVLLARITHLPPKALNEDAERVRIAAGS